MSSVSITVSGAGAASITLAESGNSSAGVRYREFTYGGYTYRTGVRDGVFVLDKELTSTGFDGDENTDWENIETSE